MRRLSLISLALSCAALAAAAQAAPPPYAPGLGDFMTAYVQPHHLKLWYAGRAGNWTLAAYEADELGETFEDVATYQADWENVPVAQLIKTIIDPALESMKAAIAAKNAGRFEQAYKALTSGCDACHAAAKKAFIRIKVPTGDSSFTDQDFSAH